MLKRALQALLVPNVMWISIWLYMSEAKNASLESNRNTPKRIALFIGLLEILGVFATWEGLEINRAGWDGSDMNLLLVTWKSPAGITT